MTRRTSLLVRAVFACAAFPCIAAAQNPQPAAPQDPHHPLAPPSSSQPPPEQIAPSDTTTGTKSADTLSDRLSKQHGTLHPPSVDPGISAPLPSNGQGTMPVIPPPGSPGGNQAVVPK
jgi:hypothetical protein